MSSRAWRGGSSRKYRRAREFVLDDDPLCSDCRAIGRVRAAEHTHHIVPLAEGGAKHDSNNMVGLCREHHQKRHGGKVKGSAVDGSPLDPDHPWNRR